MKPLTATALTAAALASLLSISAAQAQQPRVEVFLGEMPNWVREQIMRDLRELRGPDGQWRRDRWRRRAQTAEEDDSVKICSVLTPGNWRDTIQVPQSWVPENCIDFARAVGAGQAQIGCIFSSGQMAFNLVPAQQRPRPDCGWTPSEADDDNNRRGQRPPGG